MVLGNRAYLNGLNIVGMKRRGVSREEIQDLRTRLPAAVRAGGRLRRAARRGRRASSPTTARVMEIVGFIRSAGSRAICMPRQNRIG